MTVEVLPQTEVSSEEYIDLQEAEEGYSILEELEYYDVKSIV